MVGPPVPQACSLPHIPSLCPTVWDLAHLAQLSKLEQNAASSPVFRDALPPEYDFIWPIRRIRRCHLDLYYHLLRAGHLVWSSIIEVEGCPGIRRRSAVPKRVYICRGAHGFFSSEPARSDDVGDKRVNVVGGNGSPAQDSNRIRSLHPVDLDTAGNGAGDGTAATHRTAARTTWTSALVDESVQGSDGSSAARGRCRDRPWSSSKPHTIVSTLSHV
ncbi:hypothetical protein AX14_005260 [Amanita brunnescens Koide BX004]|nr:hypothetical protein AX14_005260 [Amanita brunnescens Koide BX004]